MILKNLSDLNQDFRKLLDRNVTLHYHNCSKIDVNLDSKINRIVLENCNDICIDTCGLYVGLEIKKCQNIIINNKFKQPINLLIVENSNNVDIKLAKDVHKSTICDINNSRNVIIKER